MPRRLTLSTAAVVVASSFAFGIAAPGLLAGGTDPSRPAGAKAPLETFAGTPAPVLGPVAEVPPPAVTAAPTRTPRPPAPRPVRTRVPPATRTLPAPAPTPAPTRAPALPPSPTSPPSGTFEQDAEGTFRSTGP